MSITIQIIRGRNPASGHEIKKRFSTVGQSSHCEIQLDQPDVPDNACLLEYDAAQKTLLVHCLHPDLVFLDGQPVAQHAKVRWGGSQELRIGANCRLYPGDVPVTKPAAKNTSVATAASKPAPATVRESERKAAAPSPAGRTPAQSRPQSRREKTVSRSNAEVEELKQEAAKKKLSQTIQIVLIALCAIGAVVMLTFDPAAPEKKKQAIHYGSLDEKLLHKGRDHKNLYYDIRMNLNTAHKEKDTNRSRSIYLNVKNATERRLKNFTSPDVELDREIVEFINQQL